jgi:DNA transformation protein
LKIQRPVVRLAFALKISRSMPSPNSSIPNLGPASESAFAKAGLTSAEQVLALGADEAYGRLLSAGSQPHFIGYYVLVMGLQGRPWHDCQGAEKAALRVRFDALKAGAQRSEGQLAREMEIQLQYLGVIPKAGS